jgi:hypothetical protein
MVEHYIKFRTELDGRLLVVKPLSMREYLVNPPALLYFDWFSSLEGPYPPYTGHEKPDLSLLRPYGSKDIPKTSPPGWGWGLQVLVRIQGFPLAEWATRENSFVGTVLTRLRDAFLFDQRSRENMLPLHQLVDCDPPRMTRKGGDRKFYAPKFIDLNLWRARDTLRLPKQTVHLPTMIEGPEAQQDDDLFPDASTLRDGSVLLAQRPASSHVTPPRQQPLLDDKPDVKPDDRDDEITW